MTDHAQDDVEAVAKAVEKAEWDNLELTVAEIRKAQAVAALSALAQRGLYTALDLLKHTTQIRMERDAAQAEVARMRTALEGIAEDAEQFRDAPLCPGWKRLGTSIAERAALAAKETTP